MIYPYRCPSCSNTFDVVKSVKEIDNPETCPKCNQPAERYIARTHFYGAKVEDAEYNPAFGCITKSARHRKQLAKDRGMEEIGNESPERMHKHFETQKEQELEKAWDKV